MPMDCLGVCFPLPHVSCSLLWPGFSLKLISFIYSRYVLLFSSSHPLCNPCVFLRNGSCLHFNSMFYVCVPACPVFLWFGLNKDCYSWCFLCLRAPSFPHSSNPWQKTGSTKSKQRPFSSFCFPFLSVLFSHFSFLVSYSVGSSPHIQPKDGSSPVPYLSAGGYIDLVIYT